MIQVVAMYDHAWDTVLDQERTSGSAETNGVGYTVKHVTTSWHINLNTHSLLYITVIQFNATMQPGRELLIRKASVYKRMLSRYF
jgi:hypothetical protein